MDELKPFQKLPIAKYFQHDLEKIKMAYRLSESVINDLKNIRSAGNEVEIAVKNFLYQKLFPKYYINDGHIIDENLKISPQLDVVICENSKNPVLFKLSDNSELFFYETVYCFGEIKKSFYKKSLIKDFSKNIGRIKHELSRKQIEPNYIETANSGFYIEENLTALPLRNPIFSFMFFVNSNNLTPADLKRQYKSQNYEILPNITVLLDQGIIVNVDKKEFEKNKIKINIYPQFSTNENQWVLFDLKGENNTLTYFYILLLEHLNSTTLSKPDLKNYTSQLFDFSNINFHTL